MQAIAIVDVSPSKLRALVDTEYNAREIFSMFPKFFSKERSSLETQRMG
jgi:hypothetical protein